jgi:hypothetical protein
MDSEGGEDEDLDFGLDDTKDATNIMNMASACKEYMEKFHSSQEQGEYQNQNVIRFMLEHPIIK